MDAKGSYEPPVANLKAKISLIFRNNTGLFLRFILTGLFIGIAVWFLNHQRNELQNIGKVLFSAHPAWITAGGVLVVVYVLLQGLMYVFSFASVGESLNLRDAVILFLKRNFISVFIPAGGISSLAFFNDAVENKGISRNKIYYASSIYAFVGILSVILVALPAFLFALSSDNEGMSKWYALTGAALLLMVFYYLYQSLLDKKLAYRLLLKLYQGAELIIDEIKGNKIITRYFLLTVLVSIVIEFVGIGHVYISMAALDLKPSLSVSIIAYIVVVLFLIISPFLRGLGAIEVSMSYLLIRAGFSSVESVSITLLFRLFEFWLPLLAGIVSFLIKIEKLLMRVLPSFLIFALGIVNIISVLTHGSLDKLQLLEDYLFFDVVNFSNGFVLITGLFLLVTATFMLRGLKTAWWFAFILSLFSAVGHITKGINLTESGIAFFVVFALLSTRKEYYVKSNPRIRSIGIQTALLTMGAVIAYGIIGFYFLDKKHFQIDFSIWQSIKYTLQNFFPIWSDGLVARDSFAKDFLYTIRISGFASLAFLVYSLIRPYVFRNEPSPEETEKARMIASQYGKSPLDYFKLYFDKQIYISQVNNSFISYKLWKNFAVVLEDPVAPGRDEMKRTILEFRKFCYDNGLKEIYYRVPQESLDIYRETGKKYFFIGQEAIVDLSKFSLEGGEKKSIRNALNKISEKGYTTHIHYPPLKDGLVQKLRSVSDDWLKSMNRKELVFSQGMFLEKEIKQQTVITVENNEEKIIAFMNIIPDYKKDEGTYDLLRKTSDAPNGIMDYIMVELFKYFRSQGIRYVNLGLAPMSGLNDPHTFPEKSIKFAYEKIRSFSHYKGQREYKDKFNPVWNDKFLIYDNDYDLISVPSVLSGIIKPS
jgi:phosphatidylglycerol lysyltransferase